MVPDPAGRLLSPPDAPVPVEAARLALAEVERHQTVQRTRIDMMRSSSRRAARAAAQALLTYFGDHVTGPCGHCDNCAGPPDPVAHTGRSARSQPERRASTPARTTTVPVQLIPAQISGHAHTAAPGDKPYPLHATVRHRSWGTGTVLGYEADKMTVLFTSVGYKTLSVASIRRSRLLELEPEGEDRTLG